MQHDILQLLAYSAGLFGFLLAFIYLRRVSKLERGLIEVLEQNEFLKAECGNLHNTINKAKTSFANIEHERDRNNTTQKQQKGRIKELEAILEEKNIELTKVVANANAESKESQAKLKSSESQINSLTKQLKEKEKTLATAEEKIKKLEKEKKSLSDSIKNINTDFQNYKQLLQEKTKTLETSSSNNAQLQDKLDATNEEIAILQQELATQRELNTDLEKQLEAKSDEPTEVSGTNLSENNETEETVEKYRKRALRANYFFNTMRGMKEMAEERYKNWENALELMGTWILENKGSKHIPKAIGPLVGEALAQINKESALGELAEDTNADDELASILASSDYERTGAARF